MMAPAKSKSMGDRVGVLELDLMSFFQLNGNEGFCAVVAVVADVVEVLCFVLDFDLLDLEILPEEDDAGNEVIEP